MKMTARRPSTTVLLLACFLSAAPLVLSAQPAEKPAKEISDKVSSSLEKLKEFVDAKNYAGAVTLLDQAIAESPRESYDTALISQIKAQILLTDTKYAAALAPLELAQELGEKYEFFEKKAQLDQLYLLCQIYYQLAADEKDPSQQQALFSKASANIQRWLTLTPKPTAEAHLFNASILYTQATQNAAKPDPALLQKAREAAQQGLLTAPKPKDQIYVLLLAATQQLGDQKSAADLLELLVQRAPSNALYWQQLAGAYMALAADEKDEKVARRYQLRTILTMERAQKHGFMNTPKDQLNIVGMYFNLQ